MLNKPLYGLNWMNLIMHNRVNDVTNYEWRELVNESEEDKCKRLSVIIRCWITLNKHLTNLFREEGHIEM